MNRLFPLLIFLTHIAVCRASEPATRLTFFIVRDVPSDHTRTIDTPAHPKLGYRANEPDLVIISLKNAAAIASPWQHIDKAGNVLDSGMSYQVVVWFSDADARAFAAFTKVNQNKRMAMFLGDCVLFAPMIQQAIQGGSVAITLKTQQEMDALERQLKALVKR